MKGSSSRQPKVRKNPMKERNEHAQRVDSLRSAYVPSKSADVAAKEEPTLSYYNQVRSFCQGFGNLKPENPAPQLFSKVEKRILDDQHDLKREQDNLTEKIDLFFHKMNYESQGGAPKAAVKATKRKEQVAELSNKEPLPVITNQSPAADESLAEDLENYVSEETSNILEFVSFIKAKLAPNSYELARLEETLMSRQAALLKKPFELKNLLKFNPNYGQLKLELEQVAPTTSDTARTDANMTTTSDVSVTPEQVTNSSKSDSNSTPETVVATTPLKVKKPKPISLKKPGHYSGTLSLQPDGDFCSSTPVEKSESDLSMVDEEINVPPILNQLKILDLSSIPRARRNVKGKKGRLGSKWLPDESYDMVIESVTFV